MTAASNPAAELTDLAREWHELSDHAADGTPFGGGLCNCIKQAERVERILAARLAAGGAAADEGLKDERNHWIGEAKRYERLYRSRDEAATRWFRQLKEARAALDAAHPPTEATTSNEEKSR